MYVTSKRSAEKIIHEEHCRYAKMMAPGNKVYFHSAQDAYAKGKTACRYCAAVMKKLPSEMGDIANICEANGINISFNCEDGTLEVATPMSEWKIAPVGNRKVMNLYHKNVLDYDDVTEEEAMKILERNKAYYEQIAAKQESDFLHGAER